MNTINTQRLLEEYVDLFNRQDEENVVQAIPNAAALDWLGSHIPRVSLPDPAIERTYYFRWWTYRKHLKRTPEGFVITEFHPDVSWAGKYNTINFYEFFSNFCYVNCAGNICTTVTYKNTNSFHRISLTIFCIF